MKTGAVKFSLFVIFVLYGYCHGLICEHYTDVNTGGDHACNETQIDENGICNITVNCRTDFSDRHHHCFTSWRNMSGQIEIEKQGCWIKHDECTGRFPCVYTGEEADVMFCCCDGDLCNANFFANITLPTTTVLTTEYPHEDSSAIAAYVIVALIILFVAVIAAVYFYRRRKKKFDEVDAASMVTPASRLTTTTDATNLLPPCIPEVNLPQLIEMKARGRFGCVWKAQLQDRYVAVKSFYLQDKQSWQNEQEIFNTPLVNTHPNILRFIAAASRGMGVETEFWLITEFHEHGSLADYLKTRVVSIADALCFMESMATGLAFLHEDVMNNSRNGMDGYKPAIAHRDFKSKNVLITHKKTAVIADFGLAIKFVPGESPGETHGQVGTRRYMAPEILEGAINFHRDAFLRIDMYAFALVLWEVLTRCFDIPGGASSTYMMPYEEELSQHPTIEEMQENVVEKKIRPKILHEWRQHSIIGLICETIEECWDHDVEARLSAGCVEERLRNLQKKIIAPPPDLPIQSNCLNCPPSSVEIQNQLNAQKNEMRFSEDSRLISSDQNSLELDESSFVVLPPESPRRFRNMDTNV